MAGFGLEKTNPTGLEKIQLILPGWWHGFGLEKTNPTGLEKIQLMSAEIIPIWYILKSFDNVGQE